MKSDFNLDNDADIDFTRHALWKFMRYDNFSEGRSVMRISMRQDMSYSHTLRLARTLVDQGILEKLDRGRERSHKLVLTDKGRRVLEILDKLRAEWKR